MSQRLIPADEAIRLSLKRCLEKNDYEFQPDAIPFLNRCGIDRWAFAAAVIRHIDRNRKLYAKYGDDGAILARQYHGEVELFDGTGETAYIHFVISIEGTRVRVRAHINHYPASLPW